MQNKQSVLNEIERVTTLKFVTQAYQEISVIRMQKIRGSVLNTRDFLVELSKVFYDLKISYKHRMEDLLRHHHGKDLPDMKSKKNGKSIAVFLSPNTRLQGEIILKVFELFLESVNKDSQEDIMIIGKFGRDLYEQSSAKRRYLYFEMPDSSVTLEDIKPIVYHLVQYEKVNVFHGRFENVLNQAATESNVSGDQDAQKEDPSKPIERFIFEPSLEQILQFFESQIFTLLFRQTVYESQLAQFASRINAMEQAIIHIDETTGKLMQEKRRLKHLTDNRKQLEAMSGIALWSTR